MNKPTTRPASWLLLLVLLATIAAACTQPSSGGGGSAVPAGSDVPVPTTNGYGY